MNRREFLSWVGVGAVASFLPVALAACADKTTESASPANPARPDGFQTVGTVADLDQKKQLLNENIAKSPILVVREPASPNQLVAVNPTCTHSGCGVTWNQDQQVFLCPCHDSKFAPNGAVLQGPATIPLATYEVKLEGDSVLVKGS